MRRFISFRCCCFVAISLIAIAPIAIAQQPPPPGAERTIEEIKAEAITRAENGQYPCIGQNPADLKEAFASIKTKDRDEWAAAFIAVGDRYMAEAKSLEQTDPSKGRCGLHSRLARLFIRTLAGSLVSRQAALLRKSNRSIPRAREILGSSDGNCSHPL